MSDQLDSVEGTKLHFEAIRGMIRSMGRCGIITPETQFQAGLRAPRDQDLSGPARLFFGDQTEKGSLELFADLKLAGISVPVEISGYSKYIRGRSGEIYLDDGVVFVEKLSLEGAVE